MANEPDWVGEGDTLIKCDVELMVQGPSDKVAAGWTAKALREVADRLEADQYTDGFHDITSKQGKKLGEVYFDFSEVNPI
ncbi:hypothetical protein [uncultured Ruegeria sp.]|uniref:hypothetical protein n=1 Tax=uncultured Ruegeria sp. TaxID=259304 RepID=UPI00260D6AF3|nr:hypothetical protein [uncultured Ruegeria sp.]